MRKRFALALALTMLLIGCHAPQHQPQSPEITPSEEIQQIPEDILIAATKEVIGSLDALHSKITAVRVENDNTLVFCLTSGEQIVKRWQNRSRQESCTSEMKEKARLKEMERRSHHEKC